MYTQNTPVHIKLWHRDFWHLSVANLLLTMAVYMMIPVMASALREVATPLVNGLAMGAYGIGLFLPGGFCSFLVQHYRRNHVCLWAIAAMMACLLLTYYAMCGAALVQPLWVIGLRFLFGASFGLAQMVLMSTLVIDTCESFQRTEANHSSSWFGRFAMSLGPLAALVLMRVQARPLGGFPLVILGAGIFCLLAALLIMTVNFPFKAPEDNVRLWTLDRFFLPSGFWLFLNLVLVTSAVGILLSQHHEPMFYCMMMAGFLLALIAQKHVFANAELKSEVVSGLFLLGCAQLMLLSSQSTAVTYIAPVFFGTGVGIVGARFLLFFIKLSHHCQRGTSQSTFFLGWEFGISIGLFLGGALGACAPDRLILLSFFIAIAALLLYQLFTHTWYLKHKNR